MPFDYGELRTKAKAIVQIPEHYRLAMEDNTRDEQERSFIWEDPGNDDCQIEITVDIETGQLISLDVNIDTKHSVDQASSAEEVRAVTDAFLAKHTSDYDAFPWVNSEEKGNLRFITYREEVGGLPLPDTGCRMTLDSGVNVIRYRLEKSRRKAAPKPEWPSIIVDVETVKQQVLKTMRMELTIVELYPSMYEMEGTEPEYRLVYEPIPGHRLIDAITGMDLFGMKHYVMPSCLPITHMESDKSKQPTIKDIGIWEIELGIDPELYLLENSKDDGESIKRLYKFRAEVVEDPESEALSMDAYMKRKWGDSLLNLEAWCMIQDVPIPSLNEEKQIGQEIDLKLQKITLESIKRTSATTAELKFALNTGNTAGVTVREADLYSKDVLCGDSIWQGDECTMHINFDEKLKEAKFDVNWPTFVVNGNWTLKVK